MYSKPHLFHLNLLLKLYTVYASPIVNPDSVYVVDEEPVFAVTVDQVEPPFVECSILYPVVIPFPVDAVHDKFTLVEDALVADKAVGADGQ